MGVKTVSLLEGQNQRKNLGQALLYTDLHSANCAHFPILIVSKKGYSYTIKYFLKESTLA